jgi:hypothetical protein
MKDTTRRLLSRSRSARRPARPSVDQIATTTTAAHIHRRRSRSEVKQPMAAPGLHERLGIFVTSIKEIGHDPSPSALNLAASSGRPQAS